MKNLFVLALLIAISSCQTKKHEKTYQFYATMVKELPVAEVDNKYSIIWVTPLKHQIGAFDSAYAGALCTPTVIRISNRTDSVMVPVRISSSFAERLLYDTRFQGIVGVQTRESNPYFFGSSIQ